MRVNIKMSNHFAHQYVMVYVWQAIKLQPDPFSDINMLLLKLLRTLFKVLQENALNFQVYLNNTLKIVQKLNID